MKKIQTMLIFLILLMTLSSCDVVTTDIDTPTPSVTQTATETVITPSETSTPPPTVTAVTPTPISTPFVTPTPTENPGPRNIELDFLHDKFDKIEVLIDGSYVDVSGYWESFKEIMGMPRIRSFYESDLMGGSGRLRFIKDGREFTLSSVKRTNTAYGGSDLCAVNYKWSTTVVYSGYQIPNISLFNIVVGATYTYSDDEISSVLNEYFGGDVYQLMYDSKVLKYDNSYIWTKKKTVPILNIAKYTKNNLDAKPSDLGLYTEVRHYTYIYSAGIQIMLDIYGKDTSGKGIYANVKYGDIDIWMTLDCSILDFDNSLSVNDAYHVPSGSVPVRDEEWFNGFEKIEAVYGDTAVDVTEYWYKSVECVKICDWETYKSGPALPVDYEYRMTKNGTVKTMGVSDMYDYFISEGDGLYYCDYLSSYKNAFIMTEEEAVIEGFLNRSVYQKMFKCAILDIIQENTDHRSILMNQKASQLADSLAFRITERLTGKPDIEITKRSESTCYYKGRLYQL